MKSRFGVEFFSTIFITPDISKIKFSKIKSIKIFFTIVQITLWMVTSSKFPVEFFSPMKNVL